MKLHPILLIQTVAVLLFTTGQTAEFETAPFSHFKEAKVQMKSEGIAAFSLDSEIYENVRNDFSNLRLLLSGEELPFLREEFTRPGIDTRSRTIKTENISLKETGNNTIEIMVKFKKDNQRASRLFIDTPLQDFERRVTVSGSADGTSWKTLVENGRIYDYRRFLDIRRTEILLPKNSYQYFKVVIDRTVDDANSPIRQISQRLRNGEQFEEEVIRRVSTRPFRIDRLNWFTEKTEKKKQPLDRIIYPQRGIEVSEDVEEKETVILLSSRNQPLTHFTLLTRSKNFRRLVSVQIPIESEESATRWRNVESAYLFRYDLGDFKEEKLTLRFPEQRSDRYRIVIKNHDDPVLEIDEIKAEGPEYRLLCLAEPGDQIRIYFGGDKSEELRVPRYDTTAIASARTHGLIVSSYSFGKIQSNSKHQVQKEKAEPFLNNKAFLWGAMALVAALLAWMLFGMAKKIETLPDE